MGESFARRYPYVAEMFETISRRSGVDLEAVFFGDGSPALHENLPAQVGVFAVSLAALDVLDREFDRRPTSVAGYSLGTYAAFVAAGALDRWEALDVLLEAERLLAAHLVAGRMGFVIGLTRDGIEELIRSVPPERGALSIGNENASQQFVLTGEPAAVEEAIGKAVPLTLKAELLPIRWPMHSPLLAPVTDRLLDFVSRCTTLRAPTRAALFAPMLGRRVADAADAAEVLGRQISRPSRWEAVLRAMGDAGETRFVELGPGDILTKILRWTIRGARGSVVEDAGSAADFVSTLAGAAGAEQAGDRL